MEIRKKGSEKEKRADRLTKREKHERIWSAEDKSIGRKKKDK